MSEENIVHVTDNDFDAEVLQSSVPVLVDLWAPWCAPCRAIAPDVEALAESYAGKLKVCKLNVDESPQTPTKYSVRGIPTLFIFKDGQVVDQVVGRVPKTKLEEMVKKVI
jgi:thioredoxin 1